MNFPVTEADCEKSTRIVFLPILRVRKNVKKARFFFKKRWTKQNIVVDETDETYFEKAQIDSDSSPQSFLILKETKTWNKR